MSADLRQVFRIVDVRGIDLRIVEGRLVARGRDEPIPADMVRFIRHFRGRIVAVLMERDAMASAGNVWLPASEVGHPLSGDASRQSPGILRGRLDTGWALCERERAPTRRKQLEEHWVALLHEYEAAIASHATEVAA